MAQILIVVTNIQEINALIGADGFIINVNHFSMPYQNSVEEEMLPKLINDIHKVNKEIYLNINKIFHETELTVLQKFLDNYLELVDGILFADFAIIQLVKERQKLIYYSPTQIVNAADFVTFTELKVKAVVASKEAPLETLKKIASFGQGAMLIHGHLHMFYAKRSLISWYNERYKLNLNLNGRYQIKEKKREQLYPIYEDDSGTQIFTDYIFTSIEYIDELCKLGMEYLIIDTNLLPLEYNQFVLNQYSETLKGRARSIEVFNVFPYLHTTGFLLNETNLYKVNKNEEN